MRRIDLQDLIGGGLLTLVGLGAALHSWTAFSVGTVARMGPGYFPLAVSLLLAILGLAVMIPAFFRAGPLPVVEWRPLLWISVAILAFALLVLPFGMAPATIALTILASRSDSKLSMTGTLLLAVALAAGAALLFGVGLGMHLPIFAWPF